MRSSRPPARWSAAIMYRQNRTGSLSSGSNESQPTGDFALPAQSASSVVFPKPAGVHTRITRPADSSSSASISRDRGSSFSRVRGMASLVSRSSSSSPKVSTGGDDVLDSLMGSPSHARRRPPRAPSLGMPSSVRLLGRCADGRHAGLGLSHKRLHLVFHLRVMFRRGSLQLHVR